jgi:hypothetical protein
MHVRKNAANSLIWTIAANVRKYAIDALIYVEKCPDKTEISLSPSHFLFYFCKAGTDIVAIESALASC